MHKSYWKSRRVCCAAALVVFASASAAMAAPGPIVISQLFGGGGQIAAGPNGDFVEIFNRSCVAVNLDGYSVQVATSVTGITWVVVPLPNFQLDPGKYYCVRMTTTAIGTPYQHDLQFSGSGDLMLANSGKAAIVQGDTALNVACPPLASVVDFVRFENVSAACTEGNSLATAGALTGSGRGPSRRLDVDADGVGDGCQDTDNNSADFVIDAQPCVPRNNASPANNCPGAPVFGGCNLGDGSCRVVVNAAACSALGGSYLGDCTPCVAPQACCLPTTPVTCVVESEVECQIDGGVFNAGNFSCPPSPACPPLGRCCSGDGTCIVTFEVLCLAPNTYGGNGTTCVGTPCQGRCCDDNGGCNVVGPDQCVAPSVFAGVGTDCAQPETCQGRCCAPDGTCTMTGANNCTAPSQFGGVGSNCQNQQTFGEPNPPGVIIPTTGTGPGTALPSVITVATNFPIQDVDVLVKIQHTFRNDLIICLTSPGGVTVRLTPGTACTAAGGFCGGEDNLNAIFNDEGLAIACASPNIGNLGNPPDHVIPTESLSAFDGSPSVGDWTLNIYDDAGIDVGVLQDWALLLDDGNACQGACCRPNGSCVILAQLACTQQGGTYQGAGEACSPSPCAPNGACCSGAVCSQQSQIDCTANGGIFGGVNSGCVDAPCFVPCCKQDGICQLLTASACAALPNSVAGAPGSPCPGNPCIQVGACCFEDGSCQAPLTDAACTANGGVRWRGDEGCNPNGCQGRCCATDGSCNVTFPFNCTGSSTYGGDGTNCNNPLDCQGRCCATDGSCSQTGSGNCNGVFGGVGTSCNAGYDMTTIELDFTNIDGSGALVTGADNTDDGWSTGTVGIGFTFNFYGNDYTSININNNGIMTFGSTAGFTSYENEALPANAAAAPSDAIYPLWDDLNCNRALYPAAFLRSETQGAPGSQVFIVQWTSQPQFGAANGADSNTFQAKLFEGSNRIEFHYQTVTPEFLPDTFPGTVIGIENADGSSWVQYDTMATCRAALNGGGTALRFAPSVACTPGGGCLTCTGDVNGDAVRNGKDVKSFANCVAAGGANCPCADMNSSGTADSGDVTAFVTAILTGAPCP